MSKVDSEITAFYKRLHGDNVIDDMMSEGYRPYTNLKGSYPFSTKSLFMCYEGYEPLALRPYCVAFCYGSKLQLVFNRPTFDALQGVLNLVVLV